MGDSPSCVASRELFRLAGVEVCQHIPKTDQINLPLDDPKCDTLPAPSGPVVCQCCRNTMAGLAVGEALGQMAKTDSSPWYRNFYALSSNTGILLASGIAVLCVLIC